MNSRLDVPYVKDILYAEWTRFLNILRYGSIGLPMQKISTQELRKLFDSDQKFYLVDARGADTYQMEHLPKAISLPLGKVNHRHSKYFPNKSVQIVSYCTDVNCEASVKVGKRLEELGYQNVWHYADGIKEWKQANYLTETG